MRLLGMTQAVRQEREAASEALGERHFPLSFASLRIAAAARAAVAAGFPEPDAIAVVSRGYHIAWIPARGAAVGRCRLTVSKPELKLRLVSTLDTEM